MTDSTYTLSDYVTIVRRRLTPLVLVGASLFAVALAVAFGLPAKYESSATILVEQQEIPPEMVRSTVTTYADQRIQVISQQVMTSANLLQIVEKYGMYREQLKKEPVESVLETMREQIELETVSAGVIDPRSGRAREATIAFKVTFEALSPDEAQRVANELASLYLNENLKSRRELASETYSFLSEETRKLKAQVDEFESELATFKEANADALPEMNALNLRLIDRAERDQLEVRRQIQQQEQNMIILQSELAQVPASVPVGGARRPVVTRAGQTLINPEDQLEALQTQYVGLTSRYGPEHPDVARTRREIAALEQQVGSGGGGASGQLDAAIAELNSLRQRYSDDHPDVKRLQRTVASLQGSASRPASGGAVRRFTSNPAHANLKTRLLLAEQALAAARSKEAELGRKLENLEARIAGTPQVERQYKALTRDYENALAKYREVRAKELEAQIAQTLETEQKGERFVLIEPPQLPQIPSKPNRLAVGLIGFMFSVAGGMGSVALAEALDPSVRGVKGVTRLLGAPPLATLPYIRTGAERRRRAVKLVVGGALVAGLVGGFIWAVHTFVLPLDVLWFSVLRQLGA